MFNINIGITVNITDPNDHFFANGIKQNTIILRDSLLRTGIVDNVYYVNMGVQIDYYNSTWKEYAPYIIDFDTALQKVNLLISVGAFIAGNYLDAAHKKNIKLITHVMGNEYYLLNERSLFRDDNHSFVRKTPHYDAIWISPHLYETNKDLWEVMCEAPTYVAPYIWSPKFLMDSIRKQGFAETYKPTNKPKRISVLESNVTMVKTCIYPIIIAEKLYKKYPDVIDVVRVFNATDVIKKRDFLKFVSDLRIHRANKLFFENRYSISWLLSNHTDIVLSHQRDCELNYLYFDAAWLGYPVVHNSSYVKDLGWYYGAFEADQAVEHINEIATRFDQSEEYRQEYLIKSRKLISQYLPENERNVDGYRQLLEQLFVSKY